MLQSKLRLLHVQAEERRASDVGIGAPGHIGRDRGKIGRGGKTAILFRPHSKQAQKIIQATLGAGWFPRGPGFLGTAQEHVVNTNIREVKVTGATDPDGAL